MTRRNVRDKKKVPNVGKDNVQSDNTYSADGASVNRFQLHPFFLSNGLESIMFKKGHVARRKETKRKRKKTLKASFNKRKCGRRIKVLLCGSMAFQCNDVLNGGEKGMRNCSITTEIVYPAKARITILLSVP